MVPHLGARQVAGDPTRTGQDLIAAIRSVDPAFPADLLPMSAYVTERLAVSRFLMVLMQVFAAVALLLSAVGLYGVLSYTVGQRTKELGLRLALGAAAPSLTGAVVVSGVRFAAVGLGVGLIGAMGLGQALEAQLFQVSAVDPWAFGGTVVLIMVVAVVASLVPALRASRVDPMEALREE